MPKISPEHEEARRDQILKAAEACFTRKGYHRTTVDDIVAEAGLSKGAIYTYFRSKGDILAALVEFRTAQEMAAIQNLFSPNDSTADKLKKAASFAFDPHLADPELCDVHARLSMELWAEAAKDEKIRKMFRKAYERWHHMIIDFIEEGIARGEVRPDIDRPAMASLLFATLEGLGLHRCTCGPVFDWGREKAAFIDLVSAAILRNPRD